MANTGRYWDDRPGDQFTISFTTDKHIEGIWHFCGSYQSLDGALTAYDALIEQDGAEAKAKGVSLIGCRWRLARERGTEIMEVVHDREMQPSGIADLVQAQGGVA